MLEKAAQKRVADNYPEISPGGAECRIKQLSQVLCEHSGVECNEAVEALLFRELFANYENGLIFQACPSPGCPDLTGAAALTAAESGIIFLSNGGRGMAARVEEAELVTRYLIVLFQSLIDRTAV